MTIRKLRNPNALTAQPTPQEIRGSMVDMWGLISPYSASQTGDYTLTGAIAHERVICANTVAVTITLNAKPKDLEEFTIKRTGTGAVTINGNGKTMDGCATVALVQYDGPHGIYTDAAGEWSFV